MEGLELSKHSDELHGRLRRGVIRRFETALPDLDRGGRESLQPTGIQGKVETFPACRFEPAN
ncbi:MAG: hypothetical protein QM757_20195 [Paludibaculum sp.]